MGCLLKSGQFKSQQSENNFACVALLGVCFYGPERVLQMLMLGIICIQQPPALCLALLSVRSSCGASILLILP